MRFAEPATSATAPVPTSRLCHVPGCGHIYTEPSCPRHKRTNSRTRYGGGWEQARLEYLTGLSARQAQPVPLCEDCGTSKAQEVHHVRKVSEGGGAYDQTNLRALCRACHHIRSQRGE